MAEDTTTRAPEDKLSQYLQTVKQDRGDSVSATEGARRVEAIIDELQLPTIKEDPSVWRIDSDVGTVRVGLDDEGEVLSIWQMIGSIDGRAKKHADLFEEMLRINRGTQGSCLALDDIGGERWIVVLARLWATTLDKPEFAMAIEDVFATSKLFDPPEGW